MASNCPPQLQLSLQPNTTNFKRSFEQFGVDVESPVGPADAGGSGSNGNDRNKRARSSSSFSEGSESTGSSTMASGSGSSTSSLSFSREETGISSGHPIVVLDTTRPLAPPRLPTPLIDDIDMADYVEESQRNMPSMNTAEEQRLQQTSDNYRLSLERFNAFESEMSLLRQSPPPMIPPVRPPTPPPTLPPISISTSPPTHTAIPVFQRQAVPFADNIFARLDSANTHVLASVDDVDNNRREEQSTEEAPVIGFPNALYRLQHRVPHQDLHYGTVNLEQVRGYEMENGFRDHLNSALERLRSASPLALSMGVTESSMESEDEDDEEEAEIPNQSLDAQPPTLPPIPSVVADTEDDDWNVRVAFLGNSDMESPAATSDSASPSTTTPLWLGQWRRPMHSLNTRLPSPTNPTLRDHPLPSPVLRDLHGWMDEREHTGTAFSLWMSSTDGAMGSRGEPEQSDTRNNSQDAIPSSYVGLLNPGGGEWDPLNFFQAEQATAPVSSSSTTIRPPEQHIDEVTHRTSSQSTNTTSSASSASSSSHLFATPISLPYSRNLADHAALRNLDHGIGTGLGFSNRHESPSRVSNLRPLQLVNERIARHPTVVTRDLPQSTTVARSEGNPNASATPFENNSNGDDIRSSRRPSLPRFPSQQDLSRPFWSHVDTMFGESGNSAHQHGESSPTTTSPLSTNQGDGEPSLFHDYMRQWLPSPALDADLHGFRQRYPWTDREPRTPDAPSSLSQHAALPLRVRHFQSRPGTSTSLVAENAAESRRQADFVDIQRGRHLAHGASPRNFGGFEAYRRRSQALEDLLERGVDDSLLTPSGRLPNRYSFDRSSHIHSFQGPRPNNETMTSAASSSVDSSTFNSGGAFTRRPMHRAHNEGLSPLDLRNIINDRTELNSPTGDEMFSFPAERATNRFHRRDAPDSSTANNSTNFTRHSWNSMPLRSQEASREESGFRYILNRISRPSNPMDMEGIINTSPAESRRHTLSSSHLGRGLINEPIRSLDGNPENMPVSPSDAPSLPSPDLGGSFDAERQAQVIASAAQARLNYLQNFHFNVSQVNTEASDSTHGVDAPPIPTGTAAQYQQEQSRRNWDPSETRRRMYRDMISRIEGERNERERNEESRNPRNNAPANPDDMNSGVAFESTPLSASNLHAQQRLLSAQALLNREQMNYEQHLARMGNNARQSRAGNGGPVVINVEAFRPGPFRNTVQHLNERTRQQNQPMSSNRQELSTPPTIPPLSFESDVPVESRSVTPPQVPPRTPEDFVLEALTRQSMGEMLSQSQASRANSSFASARAATMHESMRRRNHEETSTSYMARRNNARMMPLSSRFAIAELQALQTGLVNDIRNHTEPHPDAADFARQRFEMMQQSRQATGHGPPQNSTPARRLGAFGTWEELHEPLRGNDDSPRDTTAQNSARFRPRRFPRITPEAFSLRGNRGPRAMGDFIRDEDFDGSYEGLVSLTQFIGDAKPKSTPAEILEKMEKAQYKDWATAESDKRCPICLDDYGPTDTVLKLSNCSHWLHQDCLHQWLQTANTCPVCRKSVVSSPATTRGLYNRYHHMQFRRSPQNARRGPPGAPGAPPGPGSSSTPDSNANNTQPPDDQDNNSPGAPWRRPS